MKPPISGPATAHSWSTSSLHCTRFCCLAARGDAEAVRGPRPARGELGGSGSVGTSWLTKTVSLRQAVMCPVATPGARASTIVSLPVLTVCVVKGVREKTLSVLDWFRA